LVEPAGGPKRNGFGKKNKKQTAIAKTAATTTENGENVESENNVSEGELSFNEASDESSEGEKQNQIKIIKNNKKGKFSKKQTDLETKTSSDTDDEPLQQNEKINYKQLDYLYQRMTSQSSSKEILQIDKLSPRLKGGQNVTMWFQKYELQTSRWSETDRGLEVACYFEDSVLLRYWKMEKNTKSYRAIKKFMIKELTSDDHEDELKTRFYSAKQRPEESVETFGSRLLQYTRECSADDKISFTKSLSYVFMSGLDVEISKSLLWADKKTPFKKVLAGAARAEQLIRSANKNMTLNSINNEEHVAAVMSYSNKSKSNNEDESPPPKCEFCGKIGHYTGSCFAMKEYIRQGKPTINDSNQASSSRQNNSNRERYAEKGKFSNYKNKIRFKDREGGQDKETRLANTLCYNCRLYGHFARDCGEPDQREKGKEKKNE
jgi:hypothetical protein